MSNIILYLKDLSKREKIIKLI